MAAEEKWYFTKDQLANTPSRKLGYDADKELSSRQQAANLIQDMGQRLQVTQLCINTAIVYMHRFYMFHSFTRFHRNPMAAAALFLAAKVEEQPRKLEHVIKVAQICLHREHPPLDTKSEVYQEQAQELVVNENILLQTLGFDVAIDHPHTHVVRCCHLVRASKDLAQTSYFMASNSLHLTTMCLQYKPTVVACFCIHLACKWSNWEIPQSTEGKPWFWYVDRSVSQELLEQLTEEFLVMFEKCPSRLKKKIMSLSSTQNSTILSAFSNDGEKKRNGEGSSTNINVPGGNSSVSFPTSSNSEELKKKQEFQRHHPDYKKTIIQHHSSLPSLPSFLSQTHFGWLPSSFPPKMATSRNASETRKKAAREGGTRNISKPEVHGITTKSSCMFGPPQRTQPPSHTSSSSGSTSTGANLPVRQLPLKPNVGQEVPGLGKPEHLHHRPRRPEEKHLRNHEPIPPYKKYENKVTNSVLNDFSQTSSARSVVPSGYVLPCHQQQQVIQAVGDVPKPEIVLASHPLSMNKHPQLQPHVPNAPLPKLKSPPTTKVERSIFSPEKSTPPLESRGQVVSPTVPLPLTPGTSRKRSISREPEFVVYPKVDEVKPLPIAIHATEQIKPESVSLKEEKPPDISKPFNLLETVIQQEPPLSPTTQQATSVPEEVHVKEQKKKKKKHKVKDHKEKHKDKHKHKHKNRDPEPIVITIPKEKLTLPQVPEQGLKIKIAKDKIAPTISPAPTGLKIKISKEKIKESKKRDRSEDRNAGLPTKYHRPNGTTLQVGMEHSSRH